MLGVKERTLGFQVSVSDGEGWSGWCYGRMDGMDVEVSVSDG
jgi:hypothetical protein